MAPATERLAFANLLYEKEGRQLFRGGLAYVTLNSAAGRAGEHTHAGGLGRAHQTMFDWLDATLKQGHARLSSDQRRRHSIF
jgi:hypothetical protein